MQRFHQSQVPNPPPFHDFHGAESQADLCIPSPKGWRVPIVSSRLFAVQVGERSLLPLNIDRKAEGKDRQFFLGIFGENFRLEDKQMLVSHRPESRENLKILDTFVGLVLFCS
jgi:hypothetical protein